MPRAKAHLAYVRLSRVGRLEYFRRIPPHLRPYVGDRASIVRVLGCDTTDHSSSTANRAWLLVHTAVNQLITEAEAAYQAEQAAKPQPTPLKPRDAAAIGAEPWRQLLNAGDEGQITGDMEQQLALTVGLALNALAQQGDKGGLAVAAQTKALITQLLTGETLDQLGIQPDAEAMAAIQQRLLGFIPMVAGDIKKREAGDFSPADIQVKAPALPHMQVTWDQLMEQYLLNVGGTRQSEGIGINEERINRYHLAIAEVIECTGKHFPLELDVADARKYLNQLQSSPLATRTKRARLSKMKNIFKVAIQNGFTNVNPFVSFVITQPKGEALPGYRPFTRDELVKIFGYIKDLPAHDKLLSPLALLTTGARASEIICLRHTDIKQTKAGVWYIEMRHDMKSPHPHPLKTEQANERDVPIHPRLIEAGFLDRVVPGKEGYIFNSAKASANWTEWFSLILKATKVYEFKITGLHSLRNNAVDLWRESEVSTEVRHAWTGHAMTSQQDKSYGLGLRFKPDVTAKELAKVDLSWLP